MIVSDMKKIDIALIIIIIGGTIGLAAIVCANIKHELKVRKMAKEIGVPVSVFKKVAINILKNNKEKKVVEIKVDVFKKMIDEIGENAQYNTIVN
jgi:predicted transcriptional regulator